MASPPGHTSDSRFFTHFQTGGEYRFYCKYAGNLTVEGDGLGYLDLNVLRLFVNRMCSLQILLANRLLETNPDTWTYSVYLAHTTASTFNGLRVLLSLVILVLEIVVLPVRFVVGIVFNSILTTLSLGHMYALPMELSFSLSRVYQHTWLIYFLPIHNPLVLRTVKVAPLRDPHARITIRNAGLHGPVWCCRMSNAHNASMLAAQFKIRQRAGDGPEAILVTGAYVYISRWVPLSASSIFPDLMRHLSPNDLPRSIFRNSALQEDRNIASWKMLDTTTHEWRMTLIEFEDKWTERVRDAPPRRFPTLEEMRVGVRTHYSLYINAAVDPNPARVMDSNPHSVNIPVDAGNESPGQVQQQGQPQDQPVHTAPSPSHPTFSSSHIPSGAHPSNQALQNQSLQVPAVEEAAENTTTVAAAVQFETTLSSVRSREQRVHLCGVRSYLVSDEHLGTVSTLQQLEEIYNSPLGWNKYSHMRARGDKIEVVRNDRRVLGHILAILSSIILYVQFRDRDEGWAGSSIDLNALIFTNYAFITAYAAQIITGPVLDVVEAKSDRYGIMVTRAIDRGFVRGFHVRHGEWLDYRNGAVHLPCHEVRRSEVNLSCNSVVAARDEGLKVKVLAYNYMQSIRAIESKLYEYHELPWEEE